MYVSISPTCKCPLVLTHSVLTTPPTDDPVLAPLDHSVKGGRSKGCGFSLGR